MTRFAFQRPDGRRADQLRPVRFTRGFVKFARGSNLIEVGDTRVLCTVVVEESVPAFLEDTGKGWVTAEYGMLPASTKQRKPREGRQGRADGRTMEIQRLVGRVMRAAIDLELLGERTLWIDCDVLQADGGTRCAAITGAYVAVADAVRSMLREQLLMKDPLKSAIAAVSVGVVKGTTVLDLNYEEDSAAEVDMNLVMNAAGELIEVQGTAEGNAFSKHRLNEMIEIGEKGIRELIAMQKAALDGTPSSAK